MASTGLLTETDDHAQHLVEFAKAIVRESGRVQTPMGDPIRIRVGIHSGRAMSGIIGTLRSRYCLFGGKPRPSSFCAEWDRLVLFPVIVPGAESSSLSYSVTGSSLTDGDIAEALIA
jgi:hypothetical protein